MFPIGKYIRRLRDHIRLNKRTFILYSVLRVLVILTAIRHLIFRNYEAVAVCVLSLFLFLIPSFMETRFKIEIPPLFEGIIYLFIYAAEILGEVNAFYVAIPGWDTMLHTLNGFLCAAIGFSMVDLLNRHSKELNLTPFYLAMAAFCFSMTIGVMWEFIEFAGDMYFGQDMQKDFIIQNFQSVTLDPTHSQKVVAVKNITDTVIHTAQGGAVVIDGGYLDIGIIDTMKDLFVNFVGALIYSILGYIYVKNRGHKQTRAARIAGGLIVHVAKEQNTVASSSNVEDEEQAK